MSKKRSGYGISNAVTVLVVLMLLVGAIAGIAFLTNNFSKAPQALLVEVNGRVYKDGMTITPSKDKPVDFKVINLTGQDCYFNIVQKVDKSLNFDYKVNGQETWFSDCEDFTTCFDVTTEGGCFSINFEGVTMPKLLQAYHGSGSVTDVPIVPSGVYFCLIITDKTNQNNKLELNLKDITDIEVTGVEVKGELDVWSLK